MFRYLADVAVNGHTLVKQKPVNLSRVQAPVPEYRYSRPPAARGNCCWKWGPSGSQMDP